MAPAAGSYRSRPRWLSQISRRPSRAPARPSGRPPVSATTWTELPSGLIRTMRPSSTPVQMLPAASATTSSGAVPGTATTCNSALKSGAGNGRDGGGCHRIGSMEGLLMRRVQFLRQHLAHDGFDGVELGLSTDQRWCELDDGIAAIVGAAVQPSFEQPGGDPAQQSAFLVGVEGLLS